MPPTSADIEKLRSVLIAPWRLYLLTAGSIPFTDDKFNTETGVPVDSTPVALHKKAPAKLEVQFEIERYTNAGQVAPAQAWLNVARMRITVPAASIGDSDGDAYRILAGCGLISSTGQLGLPGYTAVTPVPLCLVGKNRNPLAEQPWITGVMYGGVCGGFAFDLENDLFSETAYTFEGQLHSQEKSAHGIGRIYTF